MAKASPTQAWLWHRRLSHLNFDYITLLSKKDIVTGLPKLTYVKDQHCSSSEMRKQNEAQLSQKPVPISKGRLNLPSHGLVWSNAVARLLGREKHIISGTEFFEQDTSHAYFKEEGIEHQNLPLLEHLEQTDLSKDNRNTLLRLLEQCTPASMLPLSFWAEAIANHIRISEQINHHSTHGKTAYHTLNDRNLQHLKFHDDSEVMVVSLGSNP
ncbi:retrovirus-related pol polyprotein from transposon TNT 1-94 [Tanacetum coccineum]